MKRERHRDKVPFPFLVHMSLRLSAYIARRDQLGGVLHVQPRIFDPHKFCKKFFQIFYLFKSPHFDYDNACKENKEF